MFHAKLLKMFGQLCFVRWKIAKIAADCGGL